MSVNNENPFLSADIQKLRDETGRQEAKGELILKLQRGENKKPMSLLTKLSVPTAVTAIAIVGGILMLRPSAIASPASVAKAIKDAMSYTIRSYTINDGQRVLQSEARVQSGKKDIRFFDAQGNETGRKSGNNIEEFSKINGGLKFRSAEGDIGKHLGIVIDKTGATKFMDESDIQKIRDTVNTQIKELRSSLGVVGGKGKSVFSLQSPSSGKKDIKYFVNGKEVKELPKELAGVMALPGGKGDLKVEIKTDVETVKPGSKSGLQFRKLENPGQKSTKSMMLMGGQDGQFQVLQSGQTSAEYLIKLLQDESNWNIERGVDFKGQKLDKFTMKRGLSPIELFVDPATSLPKVLRFKTVLFDDMTIEDVYEYGPQPTSI